MDLSQIGADFKAHFESVVHTGETFLADHVPGLIEAAGKLEGDELVQAAMATFLPPDVKSMVVSLIKSLEAKFPPPAPVEDAEPAAEEPAPAG